MKCTCGVIAVALGLSSVAAPAAEKRDQSRELLVAQEPNGEFPGWKSFLEDPKAKTGDVWRLVDGVLFCKGTPKGYLYTDRDYTNFTLELQWRWPPDKKPGRGGILMRITGENRLWPKSLEAQINSPDAGDLWGLAGYEYTGPAERTKTVAHPQLGKLTNVKKIEDAENPPGQWNSYKIVLDGQNVTLSMNGKLVNQASGCAVTPGKICLTAEGDAIEFRAIRLTPHDR